jgi:hypothetical protein
VASKQIIIRSRAAATAGMIANRIYAVRGQKVMLDRDLAELYGVPTRTLNQAVKLNRSRRNLARKLGELERRCNHHDQNIKVVFDALKRLIHAPDPPRRPIGFVAAHRPIVV